MLLRAHRDEPSCRNACRNPYGNSYEASRETSSTVSTVRRRRNYQRTSTLSALNLNDELRAGSYNPAAWSSNFPFILRDDHSSLRASNVSYLELSQTLFRDIYPHVVNEPSTEQMPRKYGKCSDKAQRQIERLRNTVSRVFCGSPRIDDICHPIEQNKVV